MTSFPPVPAMCSHEPAEEQVLAYLAKLPPEKAAALLAKAQAEVVPKAEAKAEAKDVKATPDPVQAAADAMRSLAAGDFAAARQHCQEADLSYLGEEGWSCLHWVVHAAGAALAAKAEEPEVGCGCCHSAAEQTRDPALSLLRELLSRPGLQVDLRSAQGATALMFAADAGDVAACAALLAAGADVKATDDDGDDAAAWARARGHASVLSQLESRATPSKDEQERSCKTGKAQARNDNLANNLHARLKVPHVASICPPWSTPFCSYVREQPTTLKPQMTRVSDNLVHAQEHLETRRFQPTYADHGLAMRPQMKKVSRGPLKKSPKSLPVPTTPGVKVMDAKQ
ncbi:unnamed protein product, partial [Effrenium voratum]